VIPNIPQDLIAVDDVIFDEMAQRPGTGIPDDYLELAKLTQELRHRWQSDAGYEASQAQMHPENFASKLARFQELLTERVRKEQELLTALREFYTPDSEK